MRPAVIRKNLAALRPTPHRLNFLVALHARIGVDIPDADAARLTTLDKLVDYCARKLGA
ncbi:MAG: hypothetical protein AB1761_00010 [Pseudomonadota bacterium]